MRPGWLVLGSMLALATAASAVAQDTSPPQVVSSEQPAWNPASFTAQPQGEPNWFIVEAKPGEQALCDLAWSYRPDRQIIIRRASFGRELTLYLWSEGARVENTRYLNAVFNIDGTAFDGRGREVTFDPLAKTRKIKGSTLRLRLPLGFLDAFANGETARIEIGGDTSGPIALKSTAAAVRAFKDCKDLPPPEIVTIPAPAPPPPPPAPSLAKPVTTKSKPRWMRRILENYPSQALREELEGRVGLSVTVGANGRVLNCQVTSSSGHSVLDAAACKGMKRYARFNPELDNKGNPTIGRYRTAINYRLSEPEPPSEATLPPPTEPPPPIPRPIPEITASSVGQARGPSPKDLAVWARQISSAYPAAALRQEMQGSVGVRVVVDKKGDVSRCFVTRSSTHDVLDKAACYGFYRYATFDPARGSDGAAAEGIYLTTITYRLDETPLPAQIPLEGEGREFAPPPPPVAPVPQPETTSGDTDP